MIEVISGRRMTRRYVVEQRRAVTPLLSEWVLAMAQAWIGLALTDLAPSWLRVTSPALILVAGESWVELAWGAWGLIGLLTVLGGTLTWFAVMPPPRRTRAALNACASSWWLALALVSAALHAWVIVAVFLACSAIAANNVGITLRNGAALEATLRASKRAAEGGRFLH